MQLSQILSNRFILLLGGDGALLTSIRTGRMGPVLAARADDVAGLLEISRALTQSPRLPVTVLLDVADMNFRRESVPMVGMLDRAKVLQRRLDLAFPEVEARGALPLPSPQASGGRREQPHLFAAVANSSDWARWRTWLKDLPNPIANLGLLPLELTDLALTLRAATVDRDQAPEAEAKEASERWTLLVCQHWTGGIRQVVLKGQELVLTRMTPAADLTRSGAEVANEVRSTLGYLSRLGFSGRAGIQVVGVGPARWAESLESSGLPIAAIAILDRVDAAGRLGLTLPAMAADAPAGAPDQVDLLSLAWSARRMAPTLDLLPGGWRLRGRLKSGSRVAAAAIAAGLLWQGAVMVQDGLELTALQAEAAAVQAELSAAMARRDAMLADLVGTTIQPRLADAATRFAATWAARPRDPAALFDRLAAALPGDIRVEGVEWTAPEAGPSRVEIRMKLDGGLSPRSALAAVDDVSTALARAFPEARVEVVRAPVPVSLSAILDAGPATAAERSQGYDATIAMEIAP